jgi:KipI family sensor histidine kinase inhibitor
VTVDDAITLTAASDRGLLLSLGNAPAGAPLDVLRRAAIPGVIDLVPGYETILLVTDPSADLGQVERAVRRVVAGLPEERPSPEAPIVEIPVCYEGEDNAPDLADVARRAGLGIEETIRRHAEPVYRVRFLGFMPGFPYLDGLDPALAAPRLDTPRTRVPAGSVAIGGIHAGIYPFATPGGWRIVGRTPLRLYDPVRDARALLGIGDRVRFVPISSAELRAREAR